MTIEAMYRRERRRRRSTLLSIQWQVQYILVGSKTRWKWVRIEWNVP